MQKKLLENDHIRLRAVEPDDADIIYDWENNTDNWQVSNTLIPFSHHTIRKYAESASQDIFENRQLRLMIMDKQQGKAVGAIDLFDYDPFHQRAGVGILINNQEWYDEISKVALSWAGCKEMVYSRYYWLTFAQYWSCITFTHKYC